MDNDRTLEDFDERFKLKLSIDIDFTRQASLNARLPMRIEFEVQHWAPKEKDLVNLRLPTK